ncbi:MAG TPA: hypothetical protein VH307_31230 [Streptosporangiaceae bacterium]|jgi:hypothetical protein|nr:hypothetical protein [Streptosporangiaceae bacterium]
MPPPAAQPETQIRHSLIVDEKYVTVNSALCYLPVGGWLAGVGVAVESLVGWEYNLNDYGVVRAEITDVDGSGLYGEFVIRIGYGFHQGGILFPEPIPNMNAAQPYVLRFLDKPPALKVFSIQRWDW